MLERLKRIKLNYSLICMSLYLIKVLALTVSFADSAVFLSLVGLIAFEKYLKFKEPQITELDKFKVVFTDAQKKNEDQLRLLTSELSRTASTAQVLMNKFNLNPTAPKEVHKGSRF